MKIKLKQGRIIGIEDKSLEPTLPNSDLSFVEDKDLYKEIRNYIKSDHRNLENQLTFQNRVMRGSNPYLAVAVDMFLKENYPQYRLARQIDSEKNLDLTRGTWNDSGLALRNLENSNSEKAQYLFNQLSSRGISEKDFPLFIELRDLKLDENLNFNLTENSSYTTAECLNWNSKERYSKINKFGLPKEIDKNSNRQIWTSNSALCRVYLDRCSNLFAGNSGLEVSNDNGRVVLAKLHSS